MSPHHYIVIYDTYCGWCYGAAPVFEALAASGAQLTVLHRHLFQGPHEERMALGKGDYVMRADARIAALTGQVFSQRYVDQVVRSETEVLASGLTAQAAALVHERGAKAELALAARLQKARYVDGVSAADRNAVVAALVGEGVPRDHAELLGSAELETRTEALATQAARLMHNVGARGVPTLLRQQGARMELLDCSAFYSHPERITMLLKDPDSLSS